MKKFKAILIKVTSLNSKPEDGSSGQNLLRTLASAMVASAAGLLFTGCAATQTALEHRSLNVQTRMSQTVFLDLEKQPERTVLLDIKNTSDKPLGVQDPIRQRLEAKGYRIVNSATEAFYILQVNVRQVAMQNPSALRQSQFDPWDSVNGGAVAGATIGAAVANCDGLGYGAAIGGVAAGAADLIAGSLVHNVTYRMITDLQILERTDEKVAQKVSSDLQQGTGTRLLQTSESARERRKYQTQIVSTANKVNLKFQKALPILADQLAQSIAGIL